MRKQAAAPDPPPELGLTTRDPREWLRAWRRVIANPSVKLVGYACADWATYGTGADIRPGTELLMKATGIKSDKTIRDALKLMRDWGWVWRYYEARLSGIEGDADIYRLTFPDDISRIPMYSPDWDPPALAPCGQLAQPPVLTTGAHAGGTGTHYRCPAPATGTHYRCLAGPPLIGPPTVGRFTHPIKIFNPSHNSWSRLQT